MSRTSRRHVGRLLRSEEPRVRTRSSTTGMVLSDLFPRHDPGLTVFREHGCGVGSRNGSTNDKLTGELDSNFLWIHVRPPNGEVERGVCSGSERDPGRSAES